MQKLTARISIGDVFFEQVVSVEIETSMLSLSDTARIKIPRDILYKDSRNSASVVSAGQVIKAGQKVKIQLGYNYELKTEFEGFVSKISADSICEIFCECPMWELKQSNFKESWASLTLEVLLKKIVPSKYKVVTQGAVGLGKFVIRDVSAYTVLSELKIKYGFVAYFRSGTLYVGFPYFAPTVRTKISLHDTVPADSINGLIFREKDDRKVLVRAISMQFNGTKKEVEIGDKSGETHTLHLPLNLSESELKAQATEKLKLFRFDGYEGEFSTFGIPFVEHSNIIELKDKRYPERDGAYFVDSVTVQYSDSGYRRTLTVGRAAANK